MGDYAVAREQMVDCQIRPNDVTDYDIIDAFLDVPREMFVPQSMRAISYSDKDIEIGGALNGPRRCLMQVTPFARLLQSVKINDNEVVLSVGSGSGYGAAIISYLAESVVGLEVDESFVEQATDALSKLDIDNVAIIQGEHANGYSKEAPFDVIVIEGAVPDVPEGLLKQLRNGGRLAAIVGDGLSAQIRVYIKTENDVSVTRFGNASAPTLPGFEKAEEFVF